MIIALAQMNPTIGAFASNAQKILSFAQQAKDDGAEMIVFPELSVTGYPPKDLLSRSFFVQDNLECLDIIVKDFPDIVGILGYVDRYSEGHGPELANAAAVIEKKRILSKHFKTLLPTYDVFDEWRYFRPASQRHVTNIESLPGKPTIGVTICEDMWNQEGLMDKRLYDLDPVAELVSQGAEMIVNISASPYHIGKQWVRKTLVQSVSKRHEVQVILVNQVGGNDSLIFDGGSLVSDSAGKIIAKAKPFQEDLVLVSLEEKEEVNYPDETRMEHLHKALILGIEDYLRKTGFSEVVIGLSGGIDSALVACLAAGAIGAENVHCVAMPSEFSSQSSLEDAQELANNLNIPLKVIPISDCFDAYKRSLAKEFAGRAPDVTEENIQARIRGNLLMALSNKFNWLVLSTGNKSELAVGYCTLYGDMAGGLAVISDVPKTVVYELSNHINALWTQNGKHPPIPQNIITKPPSAELRPDQKDTDSLPEYEILDAILHAYVEREISPEAIIDEGFEPEVVHRIVRMIDRNEYKRQQAAPGLKVSSRAFGFGRRLPIAAEFSRLSKKPF